MNTLIFEGAGWSGADTSKRTDVTNCRIRTRIKNNAGRIIYLELLGHEPAKNSVNANKYSVCGWVDACFYDDAEWDKRANYSKELSKFRDCTFEYTKENILNFVNENLNCSFDDVQVENEKVNVFQSDDPLCDCSTEASEPFRNIEVNINQLDNIKPISKWEGQANYRIGYQSAKRILKNHFKNLSEQEQIKAKNYPYRVILRWNKSGIITSLEISASMAHVSLCAEDVQTVINAIIKDNKQEVEAC